MGCTVNELWTAVTLPPTWTFFHWRPTSPNPPSLNCAPMIRPLLLAEFVKFVSTGGFWTVTRGRTRTGWPADFFARERAIGCEVARSACEVAAFASEVAAAASEVAP